MRKEERKHNYEQSVNHMKTLTAADVTDTADAADTADTAIAADVVAVYLSASV